MMKKIKGNQIVSQPIQIPNIPQYLISTCLQIESSQLSLTSQSNPFQLSVSPFKEDLPKLSNPASDRCSKSISNNSLQSFQIPKSHSEFIENILSESQANHMDSIQSQDLIISSNSIVFEKKSQINSSLTICNYYDHSNDVTPKIVKSNSDSHNLSLASDNILSSKKNFLYDKKTPIKYTKSQLNKIDKTISKKNLKESAENEEIKNINDTSLNKGKKNLKDTFEKMIKEEHSRQITEIYTKGINNLFMGTNEHDNVKEHSGITITKKKEFSTIKTKSTRNNSSSSSINKKNDTHSKKHFYNTNKNVSKISLKMNSFNTANNNQINNHTVDTTHALCNQPKKNFYHLKNFNLTKKTTRPISQNNTSRTRNKSHQSKEASSIKHDKEFQPKEKENKQMSVIQMKTRVTLKGNSAKRKLINKNIPITKIYNNTKLLSKDKTHPYKTERNDKTITEKKPTLLNSNRSNSLKTKNNKLNHIIQNQSINNNQHYQFKPKTKENSKLNDINAKTNKNVSQLLVQLYKSELNKTIKPPSIEQKIIPSININLLNFPDENSKQNKLSIDETASSPKVIQNFSRYQILRQKKDEIKQVINLDNSIEIVNNNTYEKPPVLFTKINQVFGDSDGEIIMEIE